MLATVPLAVFQNATQCASSVCYHWERTTVPTPIGIHGNNSSLPRVWCPEHLGPLRSGRWEWCSRCSGSPRVEPAPAESSSASEKVTTMSLFCTNIVIQVQQKQNILWNSLSQNKTNAQKQSAGFCFWEHEFALSAQSVAFVMARENSGCEAANAQRHVSQNMVKKLLIRCSCFTFQTPCFHNQFQVGPVLFEYA